MDDLNILDMIGNHTINRGDLIAFYLDGVLKGINIAKAKQNESKTPTREEVINEARKAVIELIEKQTKS